MKPIFVASVLALAAAAPASAITYHVDLDVGAGNASGFIETDGTLGILSTSNIIDYSLTLTVPGFGQVLDYGTSIFTLSGSGFIGSNTEFVFFPSLGDFGFFVDPFDAGNGIDTSLVINSNTSIGLAVLALSVDNNEELGFVSGPVQIGTVSEIPLPASVAFLGAGLGSLVVMRRRKADPDA